MSTSKLADSLFKEKMGSLEKPPSVCIPIYNHPLSLMATSPLSFLKADCKLRCILQSSTGCDPSQSSNDRLLFFVSVGTNPEGPFSSPDANNVAYKRGLNGAK